MSNSEKQLHAHLMEFVSKYDKVGDIDFYEICDQLFKEESGRAHAVQLRYLLDRELAANKIPPMYFDKDAWRLLSRLTHDVRINNLILLDLKAHAAVKPIAVPPGYRMEQAARWIYFFSPKTFRRVSEEIIADYRHEMIEAEAKGAAKVELRKLMIQHWGGFVISVFNEMYNGLVGKIWKALT